MTEKICVFCKHFDWDDVSLGCDTCGNMNGGFSCREGHFVERLPYDNDDFRRLILKAETCEDYAPESLNPRVERVGR